MRSADRKILLVLAGLGLAAGFWLLLVSPKRSELSDLDAKVSTLSSEVSALEAKATAGEAAKDDFAKNYERMVVLGKAVPADDEEADLIVSLSKIGQNAQVAFRSITLGSGTGVETPEIVRPNPATGEDPAAAGDAAAEQPADPAAAAAAPATEAAAATLPIGATLGPAGLGVMPWDITFDGDFFDLNRVFDEIDRMVHFDSGTSKVDGRLVTVDGFALERISDATLPRLKAAVTVRSFVAPKEEGITLGASPEGPAPATPVSATTGEVAP